MCVLILLNVCPHTAARASSYYYICVLILLYMCPHTTICVSSYYSMCPHTTICVPSYYYICVHAATCVSSCCCMCSHTPTYVSSYRYKRVRILLCIWHPHTAIYLAVTFAGTSPASSCCFLSSASSLASLCCFTSCVVMLPCCNSVLQLGCSSPHSAPLLRGERAPQAPAA